MGGEPEWAAKARKTALIMLAVAFTSEIAVVFIGTVSGTWLLGSAGAAKNVGNFKPTAVDSIALLTREMPFEYAAVRVGFFNGLLNWLGAMGLLLSIPATDDPNDKAIAAGIGSMIGGVLIMMIAFFNKHLVKYDNYFNMIADLGRMAWMRYVWQWPPRVLPLIAVVPFAFAAKKLVQGYSGKAE